MLDARHIREQIDTSQTELIDTLEQYRKIFSYPSKPESKLEDLSFDFHKLNDKTHDFIRVATRLITELENTIEKDDKFKWKN